MDQINSVIRIIQKFVPILLAKPFALTRTICAHCLRYANDSAAPLKSQPSCRSQRIGKWRIVVRHTAEFTVVYPLPSHFAHCLAFAEPRAPDLGSKIATLNYSRWQETHPLQTPHTAFFSIFIFTDFPLYRSSSVTSWGITVSWPRVL